MGAFDDLPAVRDHADGRWPTDMVGAADALFAADVRGLLRVADDVVLAFRNDDVRTLAVRPDVGNTPTEVLMRRARERGSADQAEGGFAPILVNQFFTFNPPLHTEVRRVLTRQMTPGNVGRFADLAQRLVDELLAAALARGADGFDLYADVAQPLAVRFWGALIGFTDDDVAELLSLMDDLASVFLVVPTAADADRLDRAVRRYMALVTGATARALDGGAVDPLGRTMLAEMADDLATIDVPGCPATVGLFAAGNLIDGFHTMAVGLANAAALVLGAPDAYAALRADPSLAPAVYDEGTRLATPLVLTYRYALADVEHAGVHIPAHTLVGMHWAASNRDPDAFADPLTFRLDRSARALLTFGQGPHLCPGRNVSRLVGTLALERLATAPALRYADAGPVWTAGASMSMLRSCRVTAR